MNLFQPENTCPNPKVHRSRSSLNKSLSQVGQTIDEVNDE